MNVHPHLSVVAEPPRKKLHVLGIDDALACPLSIDYLVKGLIEPGTLALMYGESTSGKSFLALHIAYLLSLGFSIFGRRVGEPVPVLYVALEGERNFPRRIKAAAAKWSRSYNFFYVTQPIDLLTGIGDAEAIVEIALALKARLIVIDTFARAIGPGSENDPTDMNGMIEALDFIKRETGAAVMVIHHSGKDQSKGPRGYSSLKPAVDTLIEVTRDDDGRHMRIENVKTASTAKRSTSNSTSLSWERTLTATWSTSCAVREGSVRDEDSGKGESLTRGERGWLNDITTLFAEPDLAKRVSPVSGMRQELTLTRTQLRDGLKAKGRFDPNADGTLTHASRQKLHTALLALKDKGKIGMTEDYVWLLKNASA